MQRQCAASDYASAKSGALPAARRSLLRGCQRVHCRLPVTQAVKTDPAVRKALKNELISALEASKGNIQADGVSELVARLVECNPTEKPARNTAALTVRVQTTTSPDCTVRVLLREITSTRGEQEHNMRTPLAVTRQHASLQSKATAYSAMEDSDVLTLSRTVLDIFRHKVAAICYGSLSSKNASLNSSDMWWYQRATFPSAKRG